MSPRSPQPAACARPARVLLLLLSLSVPAHTNDGPSPAPGLPDSWAAHEDVRAAAAQVDALVDAELARREVVPASPALAATLLRRTYLDVIGRVPTPDEQERWDVSSLAADRQGLVDELLLSPGHVSHSFNKWADLFRLRTKLSSQVSGEPFAHYLRQTLFEHTPYDVMVRELLTAEGAAHARDNGSTGLLMRDAQMPEDAMANAMRVFAGTRLSCVQCHDHPLGSWSRLEFFEMSAFFGGVGYRMPDAELPYPADFEQPERSSLEGKGLRRLMRPVRYGLFGSGDGQTELPDDYQYSDGEPGQDVIASTLFGAHAEFASEPLPEVEGQSRRERRRQRRARGDEPTPVDSRDAFADWLTAPEHPLFSRVIANRVWSELFGWALVEPLDDWSVHTRGAHPELLAHLSALVVELDFDLRRFQRVLLNTEAYARSSALPESVEEFPGQPLMRRLSAEQLWDSLVTQIAEEPDLVVLEGLGLIAEDDYARYEQLAELDAEQLAARVEVMALRTTDRARYNQALAEQDAAERAEQRAQARARRAELEQLEAELLRSDQPADELVAQELRALELREELDEREQLDELRKTFKGRYVRASELVAPTPPDHFLRMFGQSDREEIAGASLDPIVPQALALLNGVVDEALFSKPTRRNRRRGEARPASALEARLRDLESDAEIIQHAYRSLLVRDARDDELADWSALLSADELGVRDLVWTLVNSHEFRFQR